MTTKPTEAQGDWVLVPAVATEEQVKAIALAFGANLGEALAILTDVAESKTRQVIVDGYKNAIAAAPANPLLADLVAACLEWARADAAAWAGHMSVDDPVWLRADAADDRRDKAARALGRHLLAQEGEGR